MFNGLLMWNAWIGLVLGKIIYSKNTIKSTIHIDMHKIPQTLENKDMKSFSFNHWLI
jgi:hypothetical protein